MAIFIPIIKHFISSLAITGFENDNVLIDPKISPVQGFTLHTSNYDFKRQQKTFSIVLNSIELKEFQN